MWKKVKKKQKNRKTIEGEREIKCRSKEQKKTDRQTKCYENKEKQTQ